MLCSTLLSVASSAVHTYIHTFLITLQDVIDTVAVEGVENVREEDCIKIKTEEDFIQSVWIMETKQEVSVLCSK